MSPEIPDHRTHSYIGDVHDAKYSSEIHSSHAYTCDVIYEFEDKDPELLYSEQSDCRLQFHFKRR